MQWLQRSSGTTPPSSRCWSWSGQRPDCRVGAPTLGARLDPLRDKLLAGLDGSGDGVGGGGGLGLVCLLERGGGRVGAKVVIVEGCCGQHLLLVGPVEVVWGQQALEGGHLADSEQILK